MRDDRGNRVPGARWARGAGVRARVSAVFDPPGLWGVAAVVFVCFVILLRFDSSWEAWAAVAGLLVTGFFLILLFGTRPRYEDWRCRSCGLDLAGSEREGDGCAVCPACGAAWRVRGGEA